MPRKTTTEAALSPGGLSDSVLGQTGVPISRFRAAGVPDPEASSKSYTALKQPAKPRTAMVPLKQRKVDERTKYAK